MDLKAQMAQVLELLARQQAPAAPATAPALPVPTPVPAPVSLRGAQALRWWRRASHLHEGVRMGAVVNHQVVMMDASNLVWVVVWDGRGVCGT
ncbi:UNVERIFIED_CONTAM: hypothetical protein FKN15_047548 [Acipenser sinensis]